VTLRSRLLFVLAAVLPIAAILAAWQLVVVPGGRVDFILSRPSEVAAAALRLAGSAHYWTDCWASLRVLISGFVLGVVAGAALGIWLWSLSYFRRVAEAYLVAAGAAPIFALAPLFVFALGTSEGSRIAIVCVSVLIPTALSAFNAAVSVHRTFGDLISELAGRPAQILTTIIAPGAAYALLPSLKIFANTALAALLLSEWVSARDGLGKLILASMSIYNVPDMWVGLLTLVVIGIAFSLAVDLVEATVTPWRRRQ
jgi:NitT/TauT family transport system permease protein